MVSGGRRGTPSSWPRFAAEPTIPECKANLLRKQETSALIIGDEELDRRELRDRAKDRRIACSRPHLQPEQVPEGEKQEFLLESGVTH